MSTSADEPVTSRGIDALDDRRKPVARYVEFGDESVQARFVSTAEQAFQTLTQADAFGGLGQVEVRPPQAPGRRGRFRRSRPEQGRVVATSAALARIAHAVSDVPADVLASPNACRAARGVAQMLAGVATDLVRDLVALTPEEQTAHPAYRQTLRLAAELEAVRDMVAQGPCGDPEGCVGIRSPERWGRRLEDVEVSEVRAVLLRLADANQSTDRPGRNR